jgi:hypothetical protein
LRSCSSSRRFSKMGTNFSSAETPSSRTAAWDLQPEDERTALCRHQGETGRLGDDGGVGAISAQNGREGTKPPVLLPYRRRHGDVAAQPETEVREGAPDDSPYSTLLARHGRDAHKLLQQAHCVLAPGLYGAAHGHCETVVELYHVSRPPLRCW